MKLKLHSSKRLSVKGYETVRIRAYLEGYMAGIDKAAPSQPIGEWDDGRMTAIQDVANYVNYLDEIDERIKAGR